MDTQNNRLNETPKHELCKLLAVYMCFVTEAYLPSLVVTAADCSEVVILLTVLN